jgi:putative Holliday junction resolvase
MKPRGPLPGMRPCSTLTDVRWLGIDVGRRRIGLALSDDSGTLARPWKAIPAGSSIGVSATAVLAAIEAFEREALGASTVDGVVVGLPRRLGGEDTDLSAFARALADAVGSRTGLPVHLQDERLSSREAESRLAVHERDWRKRKAKIDAMAAAVVLQDFLDARADSPTISS